jgi:hypothetical protein
MARQDNTNHAATPSGAAVATSVAVGVSALAAGALAYSFVRRFIF